MELRVLVIEDDPLARDLLVTLLKTYEGVVVIGEPGHFEAARERLLVPDYDLVFLDVQLFERNGFDLVPFVAQSARLIFVTGHEDHAVRAFEVNALDYIVKPITARRLSAALERAHQACTGVEEAVRPLAVDDRLFLRGATAGGMFAALGEIAVVRSSENYSEVILLSGEHAIVRRTMQDWENILPAETFLRVHRTAIVNVACVDRVERDADETARLILRGTGRAVPVSRRLWAAVRARLAESGGDRVQRH